MPERADAISRRAKSSDIKIEKIESEASDYESAPPEYKLLTYPADYTLEVLYGQWKSDAIEIPEFQRQFVWSVTQASKLIESFLVGLPVPAIYLFTEQDSQKSLVIDGQQRLRSVFYFFDGFFGKEVRGKRQTFRLKGLHPKSKWYEKSFEEFPVSDRRKLNNSVLRAFIVQQLAPRDDTSVYHVFERLNTGGTLLTNQEIRNCVISGPFNKLLVSLNELESWRKLLGKPHADSRQRDVELLLRFFAMLDTTTYEKPLKDHLSRYMKRHRHAEAHWLNKQHTLFTKTCERILAELGPKPFHIVAGLRPAVFDCVMAAFANHQDEMPADIGNRYNTLKNNPDFLSLTRNATTDVETVRDRFAMAERELFGG